MQVLIERNDDTVKVTANGKVSHDVLGMIASSDLVKARMRHAPKAVFEVLVRDFPCMCSRLAPPIKCRCKKSAVIVEVGERIA